MVRATRNDRSAPRHAYPMHSTPVEQLIREQKIPRERPDYVALVSKIWRTPEEVREFAELIRRRRQPSKS